MRKTSATAAKVPGAHMPRRKRNAHATPAIEAQQIASGVDQIDFNLVRACKYEAVNQEIKKVSTKRGIPKTAPVLSE
jgi:hypothetical protein